MEMKPETLYIIASCEKDEASGSICKPINLSSTFIAPAPGQNSGFEYIRSDNPTRNHLEKCFATLEHAKFAHTFASGSSAISAVCHLLKSGDHIISMDDIYGGTHRYFTQVLPKCNNISTTFVDTSSKFEELENALKTNTKLLWIETPTNPMLKITDIKKAADFAKKHNLISLVDSTFCTPYIINPLDLGVDIVLHSVTKYLNGHSDVLMGALMTNNKDYSDQIRFIQNAIGAVPSPFDCYMTLRGVKTLALRMKRQCKNSLKIARFLENHPKVSKTIYPGLESHPGHKLAAKQMKAFGAIISVSIKGSKENAFKFVKTLKLFQLAESLGAVESLVNHPALMTHSGVPKEVRDRLGIDDSLLRLSVGVEDADDLIDDLKKALDAI